MCSAELDGLVVEFSGPAPDCDHWDGVSISGECQRSAFILADLVGGPGCDPTDSEQRWSQSHFYHPRQGLPGRTQASWAGLIDGIDRFDPRPFGISPREASRMDPQQRMVLETAWEALEDGGQVLERLAGSDTAVFVGISSWDYTYQGLSFQDRGVIDTYSNTEAPTVSRRIEYPTVSIFVVPVRRSIPPVHRPCWQFISPAVRSGMVTLRWHWRVESMRCSCPIFSLLSAS
jgi:hypothetical protein